MTVDIDTKTDEAAIRRLVEDWAKAVRTKDINGILASHSPDILMFDVPPPIQSKGIDEYRKTWDLFFSWATDPVVFDIGEMNIVTGSDVAFVTALMLCAGTEANGETIDLEFRLTIGLRKIADAGSSCMSIIRYLLLNSSDSRYQKKQIERSNMLQKSPMYAYIPAKDIARARKFYEQTIGLQAKEEYAGGVVYEFGKGTACFLYPTPNAGTSQASQAFWSVDDVEREVMELKARGVVFEEYDMPGIKMQNSIATGGGAKTAWFKDSEGNILAVSQRL